MDAASQPLADPAQPPTPRQVAMSWARRLKRVFGIEIERHARCGGALTVIVSIEEPEVIVKILAHLERKGPQPYQPKLSLGARAAPVLGKEFGDRAASRPGLLAAGLARRGPPAVVSGPTIRPVTRVGSAAKAV